MSYDIIIAGIDGFKVKELVVVAFYVYIYMNM
jgi:hypothetical protein